MKRSRDSTDDQKDSHAQKKVRNGTSIPFVHRLENDIGTGFADFTTNMYSSRNNKRNIDEMNGQPEPESDRPAKRMDHDHVMRDEVIMHSPRNNKRNMEEMGGQVEPDSDRPAKRIDHGHGVTWADNVDAIMHSPVNNKRSMEEMNGQLGLESDRPAKRLDHGYNTMPAASDHDIMRDEVQPNQGLGGEMTVYANRVRVYHRLLEISIDENLCNALNVVYASDITILATTIHDSPQHIRLWALQQLDEKFRRTIIELMSDIERHKENNDPKSALPTIMTDSLARERVVGTRTCFVCEDGFCSENKKNPVDVEDVVWKDCGAHLMHLECFRRQVLEGKMPLKGLCACIDNVC
ncbi:uncharacterized protein BKA55DRAFT_524104 [Fusarium redolens]|uniref:Uncharacterized protein n=1 Tax=Fusarium redolens TaxID=48865 RepID=A0A9P9FXZ0_FUSRE|nr:uncharacterized protein BKA55DRAFT_526617 [Fusarium redolens]XP_046043796.1 uncharacterized protein BKA55DRAFT_524104 [Fusarium redolens]KAH7228517.1 hypothetical protein BKA55DRAFT_526617 [Fusarium redolens]KAH7231859.1 hypothetical protein BKA55DRAFT_524104 [Fusarium redolens]